MMMMGLWFLMILVILAIPILLIAGVLILTKKPAIGQGNPPAATATPPPTPASPAAVCSHCGAKLQPQWAHCPQCGAPTGP